MMMTRNQLQKKTKEMPLVERMIFRAHLLPKATNLKKTRKLQKRRTMLRKKAAMTTRKKTKKEVTTKASRKNVHKTLN
jgi:hypothetical protein